MKPYLHIFVAILVFLPWVTFAQGLQEYINSIITFISNVLIPFSFGIAFLIFAVNAIRFFVLEGNNEDGREKAKALALYSVMAIVIIIIFWGTVSLLAKGTGLNGKKAPVSDYVERGLPTPSGSTWTPTGGASI